MMIFKKIKFKNFKFIFNLTLLASTFLNLVAKSDSLDNQNLKTLKENAPYKIDKNYLEKNQDLDYILDTGDKIQIIINPELPEFNTISLIDINGTINIPRFNRVYVAGLTINELRNVLNEKYEEILNKPDIEIVINSYRPINAYIYGEVESPGLYTLNVIQEKINNDLLQKQKYINNSSYNQKNKFQKFPTIFDIIRKAGGITEYSNIEKIIVTRNNSFSNGGGKIRAEINFAEVIKTGNYENNIRLRDGDYIVIEKSKIPTLGQFSMAMKSNLNPKFISVYVSGRVESPGEKKVTRLSTVQDAIVLSGGTKALKGKINLIRLNQNGELEKLKISSNKRKRGSKNNPYLKDGDIIYIGKSPFNITSEILGEILDPFGQLIQGLSIYEALN